MTEIAAGGRFYAFACPTKRMLVLILALAVGTTNLVAYPTGEGGEGVLAYEDLKNAAFGRFTQGDTANLLSGLENMENKLDFDGGIKQIPEMKSKVPNGPDVPRKRQDGGFPMCIWKMCPQAPWTNRGRR
ncbi:uncharacterized protein LOC106153469 [Lingula anatina]|uniref:Uncharacterized protein LOC106153469 n=1 Tax=Lingula anatina TaxID=7574 RepID=A0A1S3HCP9_LINAN|nr:uncharacterized protein LOC106153469 [Lingula anatina]|eukprot:XP_013382899.1 uncharacterized protein LOC106153469 [Lingula anatina]